MKVSFSVIIVHVLLVLIAFLSPVAKKEPKEKIVVKTRSLPQKPMMVEKPTKATPSKVKEEKPISALPKKPSSSTVPSKKLTAAPPATKPAPKQTKARPAKGKAKQESASEPVVPGHLLRELEETIAKIDEKRDKLSTGKTFKPLQKREPLQSEKFYQLETSKEEENYKETLVRYLHHSLHLPDFGDVKIQITLWQDGSVKNLKVLKTESEKNRKYLEQHLPLLKFPSLPSSGLGKNENTFILTFCNEL